MKFLTLAIALLVSVVATAQPSSDEASVRLVVQAFYDAFNSDGFDGAGQFTTEDWNHITPLGGRTRGRTVVLQQLKQVHATFLKGVIETIHDTWPNRVAFLVLVSPPGTM